MAVPCPPGHGADVVAIVDDDVSVRETLALALRIEGFAPLTFGDGAGVLAAVPHQPVGCIVLDVTLPDTGGLEVLRTLFANRCTAPVIMMSGHADIACAVEAMKLGALDFLEKPFTVFTMVERVRHACELRRAASELVPQAFGDGSPLTPRETEVLEQIAYGASNKEAGRSLGISPRTVEVHRARIMEKVGARNAADLMRIVLSEDGRRARTIYSAASGLWRNGSSSRSQT